MSVILILALLLRIFWGALIPVVPISDSLGYDAFSRTLVEHGVYGWTADEPHAFWPPGTSFLYALVYKLFGIKYSYIVFLNIALSGVLIICSFRVTKRYYGNDVAICAAMLLAVWPTLIMYTTILASELPYMVLTIAALDAWTSRSTDAWIRGIIAGLLLGVAALVRPLALVLPVIYAVGATLPFGLNRGCIIEQTKILIAVAITMVALITPWTLRNYELFGQPVLVSTNGGITFWMGNTPGTNGRFMDIPDEILALPENERETVLEQRAWSYIRDEPGAFVYRTLVKLVLLYSNESVGVGWNSTGLERAFGLSIIEPLKRFTQLSWAFIFLVSVIGLFRLLIRDWFWRAVGSPFVLCLAFYSLVHSLFVAQERYHIGFAPHIAVMFSVGVLYLNGLRHNSKMNQIEGNHS